MTDPALGPYLFDTSAEYWLAISTDSAVRRWHAAYLELHAVHVSAITVMERMRGYALSIQLDPPGRRRLLSMKRQEYLDSLGEVRPVDAAVAMLAGELAALLPQPPTPPKRSHRTAEVRQERLVRWRNDILIAATALVAGMPLVHYNPRDFETIRTAIETSPQRFPTLGPLNLVSVLRLAT
ncbi:MAG: type II toxin-antitoxin system VapC family toxin [Bryobacteraceae bacterium]